MRVALIDSSVLAAWILPDEEAHDAAARLMVSIASGEIEPVFAAHLRFELRSGLVRAARRGRIGWDDLPAVLDIIDALEASTVALSTSDAPFLALVHAHQLGWGDAHWVEIASRLDLPLITADLKLIRSVPDEVAIVVDVREAVA
ncbi:MAG: type II toxin-antitoxin system VapC family toxin [Candidatus Limnocylindrales bacterium]